MRLESRLYYYGLGMGIPYGLLNSVARTYSLARCAYDVYRRQRLTRDLLRDSSWSGFIPKDRGYARVQTNTLPGIEEALQTVRQIIRERRKTGWKTRDVNPVDHLELPEHFRDHPEILNFALSDKIVQIVCDYYGMVPQLKEIGIWVTREQEKLYNSQLFHLDKPEVGILALFINVERNDEEKGPVTLLPADISKEIRKNTRYDEIYFRGSGYISDEMVFHHCSPQDQITLAGGPGTGTFCDTSRCFHYGSRCHSGERIMMMVKFMPPHRAHKTRTPLFDLVPEPEDEVRRLMLSGAAFVHR